MGNSGYNPPSHPPPPGVCEWKGHFYQNGQQFPMHFRHMCLDMNGHVTGDGSDAVGGFSLSGQLANGWMSFVKQYHGKHSVNYNGQCNDDSGWFRGTWQIPGDCGGNFEIKVELPRWKGNYVQGGHKHHME